LRSKQLRIRLLLERKSPYPAGDGRLRLVRFNEEAGHRAGPHPHPHIGDHSMKRYTLPTALLLVTALAVGCTEQVPTSLAPDAPQLGKTSSGSTDTDPRAKWDFHSTLADGTPAKLTGDGRSDVGVSGADPSVYQGDVCGVSAKIFVGNGGGDAVIDPDKNYSKGSCDGGARYLRFDLSDGNSPVKAGAFTNARGVWKYREGETRDTIMQYWYNNIPNCEILRFSNEKTPDGTQLSPVRTTRLANDPITGAGRWTVESVANTKGEHRAGCVNWIKGAYRLTDQTYNLPFRATITEVVK
jgi:hypothetical protein